MRKRNFVNFALPGILGMLGVLLAACSEPGTRCTLSDSSKPHREIIVSVDSVFGTIDIDGQPTHHRGASWVERLDFGDENRDFVLVVVQKVITAERKLGENRTQYRLSGPQLVIQALPDGKPVQYTCRGSVSPVEFLWRAIEAAW